MIQVENCCDSSAIRCTIVDHSEGHCCCGMRGSKLASTPFFDRFAYYLSSSNFVTQMATFCTSVILVENAHPLSHAVWPCSSMVRPALLSGAVCLISLWKDEVHRVPWTGAVSAAVKKGSAGSADGSHGRMQGGGRDVPASGDRRRVALTYCCQLESRSTSLWHPLLEPREAVASDTVRPLSRYVLNGRAREQWVSHCRWRRQPLCPSRGRRPSPVIVCRKELC